MQVLSSLFALCLLGSIAGLLGGLAFITNRKLAKLLSNSAIPLAAGVLLATSLLDLMPHAAEHGGEQSFTIVLFVFVAFFVLEHFFLKLHHHDHKHDSHDDSKTSLVIFGDTIHNFLDGVAIAAAFLIDPALGFLAAFATFLHEVPHEIADFGILLAAGWKKTNIILANLLSALSTFVGAISVVYFADYVENLAGLLLAAGAGLFLYIATTDFLPEITGVGKRELKKTFLIFLIGIGVVFVMSQFIPHVEG